MTSRMQSWIKEKAREAQYAVTRKSPAQKAFLECTTNEKWGPTNTQMLEVCNYASNYQDWENIKDSFSDVFQTEGQKHVRVLKKALLLLEYLINNGSSTIRNDARMFMGDLQGFVHMQTGATGEKGAVEAVVRKKAQDIINLINDDELYRMEHEKAHKLKGSLNSVTNDGFGNSYESSTYGSFGHGVPDERATSFSPYSTNTRANAFDPYNTKPGADDEYYSEDEGMPAPAPRPGQPFAQAPAPAPAPAQSHVNPLRQQPQNAFNPFQSPSAAVTDEEDPYQKRQQSSEVFNPFAQQRAQQAARPTQSNLDDLLGVYGSSQPTPAPTPAQQPVGNLLYGSPQPSGGANLMFGNQQPAAHPSGGANLMFGNQQPRAAQPQPDLFFGGQPAAPQPVTPQPAARPAQFDDFLDLSAPQRPKQGGNGMLSEFGDLVNLDLTQPAQQRTYGRAGLQQRGSGATLGGRPY